MLIALHLYRQPKIGNLNYHSTVDSFIILPLFRLAAVSHSRLYLDIELSQYPQLPLVHHEVTFS